VTLTLSKTLLYKVCSTKVDEKFEDTKGMMRIRKSNKDRQDNRQLNIVYTKKASQYVN